MGTATVLAAPRLIRAVETFHTLMGTATRLREALSRTFRETFHTPMGTATPRKCNHHTDR